MKQAVKSGLPVPNAPIEWATIADGVVYTAQIPIRSDGTIETGDIRVQTRLTLDNLRKTLLAAGGDLDDVAQVLVYLPDPKDFTGMNEIYGQHFGKPYPNRATIVAQLMVPGARIEIVAYAHVSGPARANVTRKAPRKSVLRAPAKSGARKRR
jgi:enamine deaminase RidA (YjgF/YER057c/UK114 family)